MPAGGSERDALAELESAVINYADSRIGSTADVDDTITDGNRRWAYGPKLAAEFRLGHGESVHRFDLVRCGVDDVDTAGVCRRHPKAPGTVVVGKIVQHHQAVQRAAAAGAQP